MPEGLNLQNAPPWKMMIEEVYSLRYTDLKKARTYCEHIVEMARKENDNFGLAFGYYYLGEINLREGNSLGTINYTMKALPIAEENNFYEINIQIYNALGIMFANEGDEQRSLDHYFKGLDIAVAYRHYILEGMIESNIGDLYQDLGDYETAIYHTKRAYAASNRRKEAKTLLNLQLCNIFSNIALSYYCLNDFNQALDYCEKAKEKDKEASYRNLLPVIESIEARTYFKLGKLNDSYLSAVRCMDAAVDSEEIFDVFKACILVADLFMELHKNEDASKMIDIIRMYAKQLDSVYQWIETYDLLIRYYKHTKNEKMLTDAYITYYEWQQKSKRLIKESKLNSMRNRVALENARREQERIQANNLQLKSISEHDALTGLANRYKLNKYSNICFEKAVQLGTNLGIIIIDVDYFKEFNDTYGHLEGDRCIQNVAKVLSKMKNTNCFPARFGGDEFFVIVTNYSDEQILDLAATIKKMVNGLQIAHEKSLVSKYVTVSQGIVNRIPDKDSSIDELISLADAALYNIKKLHRNNFLLNKEKMAGN
ncbi:MAG TPA: diguanylate cyclase [Lachnospiraceae bacterium]|nr:diguanylate cyclase [Lachnospiraceae bacterium]